MILLIFCVWSLKLRSWTVSIMAQGASSTTLSHSRATSPRPESHKVGRNLCWRPLCFTSMRSHSHHYFPLSQQSTCSQRILAKVWWNGVNIAQSLMNSTLLIDSQSTLLVFQVNNEIALVWYSFKANNSALLGLLRNVTNILFKYIQYKLFFIAGAINLVVDVSHVCSYFTSSDFHTKIQVFFRVILNRT